MKVIICCSKCFKNYPANLIRIWEWDDGNTYQYMTKCLNCGVMLDCIVSEVEEIPQKTDCLEVETSNNRRTES